MTRRLSPSSRTLDALLSGNHPEAERLAPAVEKLKDRFHRTQLHAYRTGKSKPLSDAASEMEALTNGVVRANGWITDETIGAGDGGEAA